MIIPDGYRILTMGERKQRGDLAWTWNSPDCVELGWVSVESGIVDEGHVVTIRKLKPEKKIEKKVMEKHSLQEILDDNNYNTRAYSGRGMYGRACLGVAVDNVGRLLSGIVHEVNDDNREEIAEAFRGMAMDSLGLGTIVYFPEVTYVSDDDYEQD